MSIKQHVGRKTGTNPLPASPPAPAAADGSGPTLTAPAVKRPTQAGPPTAYVLAGVPD